MDDKFTDTAPNAGKVLKYMSSLIWKWKWLFVAASVGAAVLTAVIYRPDTTLISVGRAILTTGVAPSVEYIMQSSGSALTPLESPRSIVVRISDPAFRTRIVNSSQFGEATASLSKSMVYASLKGIASEGERDVAIELSAGSSADVLAAFTTVATEIQKAHAEIMNRRLAPLQARLEEAKSRIAQIEKANNELNERIFNAEAENARATTGPLPRSFPGPGLVATLAVWNQLRDRIQSDTNLAALSEPSFIRVEPALSVTSRSIGTLRASMMAGLIMLLSMIVLTLIVNSRKRL